MKKLIVPILLAGLTAFSSCGPSKQRQEAKEKIRQDSIHAADSSASVQQQQMADEKAKHIADSLATVRAKMDSIARADSLAKAKTVKKPVKKK